MQSIDYGPTTVRIEQNTTSYQTITGVTDASKLARDRLQDAPEERFVGWFLNNRNEVIGVRELFRGSTNSISIEERKPVKAALRLDAVAVVLAHNHPSGKVEPSDADLRATHKLERAFDTFEITLSDHLIVNDHGETYSMKQQGDI